MEAGWIVTEVGRQPWIVQGFMRTEEAVTRADGIWFAFAGTLLLYTAIGVIAYKALKVIARQEGDATVPYGPGPAEAELGPPEREPAEVGR
jgi:cytochrome d ubiquinol oxidase subunit I